MSRVYQTEQRKELLRFLKEHKEEQFSIEAVVAHVPTLGKSTVYRLMARLLEEGKVRKRASGKGRTILYQYIDHDHCDSHLHLQCMECGKTIHLPEEFSQRVESDILSTHGFKVNGTETLFFGECEDCSEKKS